MRYNPYSFLWNLMHLCLLNLDIISLWVEVSLICVGIFYKYHKHSNLNIDSHEDDRLTGFITSMVAVDFESTKAPPIRLGTLCINQSRHKKIQ